MESSGITDKMILPPKAIIFDLDGTLIRSSVNFAKFRTRLMEYIEEKGGDISRYDRTGTTISIISEFEDEMRSKGREEKDIHRYLDEIDSIINEIELEKIEETRPIPGAHSILQRLRDRDIRIGILTRGCAEYAEKAVEIAGLRRYIDALASRDRKSGIEPKPDPSSVRHVLELLGVEPEETIMIGDYSIDFDCAVNSNIRFFGIASSERSLVNLRSCGCSEIVSSLEDFLERIGID